MLRDRTYLLWAVFPILPMIAGFSVLSVIDGPKSELTVGLNSILAALPEGAGGIYLATARGVQFLNALFIYLSVGMFHLAACASVMAYMIYQIWLMPQPKRARTGVVLLISAVVLLAVNYTVLQPVWRGALSIAYRNLCDVIVHADVAVHLMPGSCDEEGISRYAALAAVPYVIGVIAATFASAVVAGAISARDEDPAVRLAVVQRAFQATALILVTSMLAMVLFYKLPLSVLANGDARDLVSGYAEGITMYWGTLATLTLVAIFGPANMVLGQAAKASGEEVALLVDSRTRGQIKAIVTTLAPLLIGSSGAFFQTIANALTGG